MEVTVKGFPTEVGEYIELPDMGELLTYPFFLDNYIEDVRRLAPSFIRYLLDKVPLKGGKKFTSVRSEVKFLHPNSRACTGYDSGKDGTIMEGFEWHIDSDISLDLYHKETDVVHLLSSPVKAMSLFNKNEFIVDAEPGLAFDDFFHLIATKHMDKVIAQEAEPNKIITFTNHMHRAQPSPTHELRYMLRVVETDRERLPSHPTNDTMRQSTIYDIDKSQWVQNILNEGDKINLTWRKSR